MTGSTVIYLRVSTSDQARKGYSLPEQRDLCLVKARQLCDAVPVVFEDTAGGDLIERPGLEQLRNHVREYKPAYLICMDPDRFSRSLKWQLLVADEIEGRGTRLVFVQQDYDPDDMMSRAFFQFRGLMSELDKAKILDRTSRGVRGKLRADKLPYAVPIFGYSYDTAIDTLVINEEEALWVRQIFEWFGQRVQPMEIRNRLNAIGVKTKKSTVWYTSTIRSILHNSSYTGEMICHRYDWRGATAQMELPKELRKAPIRAKVRPEHEWIRVPIPAIISQDTYDEAQKSFRRLKHTSQKVVGLMSGIVRCGLCEGAVHYIAHKSVGHYLRCINKYAGSRETKERRQACSLPLVQARVIEGRVWSEFGRWLLNPDAIQERSQRTDDMVARVAHLDKHGTALRQQLAGKRKEQTTTLRMVAAGHVDEQVATESLAELKAQIEHLTAELARTEQRAAEANEQQREREGFYQKLQSAAAEVARNSEKVQFILEHMPVEERRRMLLTLGCEVYLYPDEDYELRPPV